MERYDKYKDSGVEWIGEIPEHWEVKKLKYVLELISEKVVSKETNFSYTGMENIEAHTGRFLASDSESDGLANLYEENDILFGKLRPYLSKVHLAQHSGICSTEFLVYRIIEGYSPIFYQKLMISPSFIEIVNSSTYGAKMPRANSEFINNQFVPCPPIEERNRIATFLDKKTSEIDAIIAKKEALVERLKEQRQAIINEAVTKGLNPNARMKESGIEWLGEIPAHWEVVKLKHLFDLVGGGTPSKLNGSYWEGSIPWVSPKDMKFDRILKTKDYLTEKGIIESTTNLIDEESLLMVVRSGILQRIIPIAIAGCKLTINQDIKAFIKKGNLYTKFLYYFIKGNDKFLRDEIVKRGATVESVEVEFLNNVQIPVPSAKEQNKILSYLENKFDVISKAQTKTEDSITKLKSYRQSLISEAVTGKIKV